MLPEYQKIVYLFDKTLYWCVCKQLSMRKMKSARLRFINMRGFINHSQKFLSFVKLLFEHMIPCSPKIIKNTVVYCMFYSLNAMYHMQYICNTIFILYTFCKTFHYDHRNITSDYRVCFGWGRKEPGSFTCYGIIIWCYATEFSEIRVLTGNQ